MKEEASIGLGREYLGREFQALRERVAWASHGYIMWEMLFCELDWQEES